MDLRLLLEMVVAFDPARIAVSDAGRAVSTGELDLRARSAADRFENLGGSHVAFCAANGPALPIALFGAVNAGLPFVPLNYRLADAQLAQVVRALDIIAVADERNAPRLRELGVERLLDPKELLGEDTLEPKSAREVVVDPDDIALLLYTSGTTAAPKAAVLRHRHLAAYVIGTVEFGAADPADAVLVSVPPYHIAGIMNLLSNLYLGRRIVYLDPFDAQRWLETVRREAVTHAMVVPTMLARIISALDGSAADTPSLRSLAYGGARMPAPVIEQALRTFSSVAFTNAYGLTETSSTITVLDPDDHREALASNDPSVKARLQSAGRPLPGIEIEIRDGNGRPADTGCVGNIYVRGEQVAGEYLGAPVRGDRWFATRDRGCIDEAGYLFIEGRADDTIIRGGENIAPAEIEDVLFRHDGVADCAVVGIDDDEWGQLIAAAVVLARDSDATPEELRTFAKNNLRSSKTPDLVVIVDALPYTDTGKVVRRAVREQLSRLQNHH